MKSLCPNPHRHVLSVSSYTSFLLSIACSSSLCEYSYVNVLPHAGNQMIQPLLSSLTTLPLGWFIIILDKYACMCVCEQRVMVINLFELAFPLCIMINNSTGLLFPLCIRKSTLMQLKAVGKYPVPACKPYIILFTVNEPLWHVRSENSNDNPCVCKTDQQLGFCVSLFLCGICSSILLMSLCSHLERFISLALTDHS